MLTVTDPTQPKPRMITITKSRSSKIKLPYNKRLGRGNFWNSWDTKWGDISATRSNISSSDTKGKSFH